MKILVLNYEFPPLGGGAAPVSYEIAKKFKERGHSVDVITSSYKDKVGIEVKDGIRIIRARTLRFKKSDSNILETFTYLVSGLFYSIYYCMRKDYDIIHSHFVLPVGILAFVISNLFNIPYVITIHGSDIPGYSENKKLKFLHRFTPPLICFLIEQSKCTISPSNYLKNLLKASVPNAEVEVIPNGIEKTRLRRPVVENKKNQIFVATRLVKRKGIQYVLKALSQIDLDDKIIDLWTFHIAGAGPYLKDLQELAESSKIKVVFHGWVDDDSVLYKDLYCQSKVYVLPSKRENGSISLIEAMASKCAIITSNDTGCAETVGDTAIKVPNNNVEEISQSLKSLLEDNTSIERYSNKAYDRYQKYFTWDAIISKYIKTFKDAK
jgi:glycosyltransferase involved in cell wall biosynthesis